MDKIESKFGVSNWGSLPASCVLAYVVIQLYKILTEANWRIRMLQYY